MHSDAGMSPQSRQSPIHSDIGTPPARSHSFHQSRRHAGGVRQRSYTYDVGQPLGYQSSPSILGLDDSLQMGGRLPLGGTNSPAKMNSIDYLDIQQSPSTATMFGMSDCAGNQLVGSQLGSGNDFQVVGPTGDNFCSSVLPSQQDLIFSLEAGEADAVGMRTQADYSNDVFPPLSGNGPMHDCMTASQYTTSQSQEWRHSWPRVPRLQ